MAETYFNITDGRLCIGEAAIAQAMEQPGNELVLLTQLILSPGFELPERYDRMSSKGWNPGDYELLGHWMVKLLGESDGAPQKTSRKLSYAHFDRLNQLGLMPHADFLAVEFGSFPLFCEQIGAQSAHQGNKFSEWTTSDFVAYARQVSGELGRKPKKSDYQERYLRGEGPHADFISHRIGNNKLNELIGYPNISSWEDDDYFQWGARVLIANDGNVRFTKAFINQLSRLKRGPSEPTVRFRFGSLSKFQERAEEELNSIMKEQAEKDESLMVEHDELLKSGKLTLPKDMERQTRLRVTGQYLVARQLLPSAEDGKLILIAQLTPNKFLDTLLHSNSKLTAGYVETTAERLGVFDYIWPMDEWRQYLKVA